MKISDKLDAHEHALTELRNTIQELPESPERDAAVAALNTALSGLSDAGALVWDIEMAQTSQP